MRAEFLDGSALAAQQMGRPDLPVRLEQAWRASATMLRLRRWLGAFGAQPTVLAAPETDQRGPILASRSTTRCARR